MDAKPHSQDKIEPKPSIVEQKWSRKWIKDKIFSPNLDKAKKPYYNLMMFPYPSAEGMHVGNMYAFTGADIWARFMRMKGLDVFEPIGLDGFGIHSENYALSINQHPAKLAKRTEKNFYKQLRATGNSYDWTRALETYDIDYYRWTQWLFVQMFKHGLAYRKKSEVNWCPSCKTVLADEQVVGGECERCSSKVVKKNLEQWFFKITKYAERLRAGIDKIDWPEKIKTAQRNWIGKKEGITINYQIPNSPASPSEAGRAKFQIKCWTSRPDTNFGATFVVLAPEHELVEKLTTPDNRRAVSEYIKISKSKTQEERIAEGREKTGVFTGVYAVNELNGEKLPIWISDFVLSDFGTGAVVGVPGHDRRDFEFAKKYKLPVKRVIVGLDKDKSPIKKVEQVQEGEGTVINSDFLNGLKVGKAVEKIMDYIEEKGWGKRQTTYHLRDWLISRQRYWGPPIPMIYCKSCKEEERGERKDMPGWWAVEEKDLPVKLPFIVDFKPRGTGESPLAQDKDFVQVKCPKCGAKAMRETDVSDTFLDSSWYFLRYLLTDKKSMPFPSPKFTRIGTWQAESKKIARRAEKWLPVDMYIGGAEHSVLHLMYVRFITMVLYNWGYLDFKEPFPRFYAHGLLIKDGAKMSKSKGNVVVPDAYIKKYGADTLRTYLMFLGPFDQGGDFRDSGIDGMYKFLKRVWNLVLAGPVVLDKEETGVNVLHWKHKTIKRVSSDVEKLRFNRAIAGIMEYVNFLRYVRKKGTGAQKDSSQTGEWQEAIETLILLLAPFAPFMSEELYQRFMNKDLGLKNKKSGNIRKSYLVNLKSVHFESWPKFDPKLAQSETVIVPVQVNGKLRTTLRIDSNRDKDRAFIQQEAGTVPGVARHLAGKKIQKVIFVPGRLINFVVV